MRIALPVVKLGETPEENLNKVVQAIEASKDCDFVFFAETTITGLISNDNVSEMLALGQEVPGDFTEDISRACVRSNVWVSIGLLEREKGKLFDTAVVINSSGKISMNYRRMSPGWHWPSSDPDVFCEGTEVFCVNTPFGKMATLICGDFFDNQNLIGQVSALNPDFLHLLLVRSGAEKERYTQEEWDTSEISEYATQVKSLGISVFMVNYIDNECFGGATVFDGKGNVVSSLPLWQDDILKYDIDV